MIGPWINNPDVNNPNIITRSPSIQGSPVLILSQIRSPIKKMTSANGISDRTSVARRGLNKLKPNAANEIAPARLPYSRDAIRNNASAISAAQSSDGNRHATSHDRVTVKTAAEIQPVSGGLVASP